LPYYFKDGYDFLVVNFEVLCRKCNHQATSSDYDNDDFVKACLYDRKEAQHKKQAEKAYVSCLADVKWAENETSMTMLKKKEFNFQLKQQEQASKLEQT
jgi:hypothetical protein